MLPGVKGNFRITYQHQPVRDFQGLSLSPYQEKSQRFGENSEARCFYWRLVNSDTKIEVCPDRGCGCLACYWSYFTNSPFPQSSTSVWSGSYKCRFILNTSSKEYQHIDTLPSHSNLSLSPELRSKAEAHDKASKSICSYCGPAKARH